MIRPLLTLWLALVIAVVPVFAEDVPGSEMFGDLIVADNPETPASPNRTPEDVLDDIEAILQNVYDESGNRYEVKIEAGTSNDNEFKTLYETASGNLKALWKEFHIVLKGDMNSASLKKDRAFTKAANQAMDKYKAHFGGSEGLILSEYSKVNKLVNGKSYNLRYNKKWMDKHVQMNDYTRRTPTSDPTKWNQNDIVYLVGILPLKLRKDMNTMIKSAYLYGYMNQAASRNLSVNELNHYSALRASDLAWDTYIDDAYYYDNIYNSRYLVSKLSNTFDGMTTRTGDGNKYIGLCKKAIEKMKNAQERAKKFKEDQNLGRDDKGRIEFTGSKGKWKQVSAAYTDICNDMKNAMSEFHEAWSNFVKAHPGNATSEYQQAMEETFNNYYQDFEYAPVDSLDARYKSLKRKSGQFKLDRVTSSMFTGAVDKTLYIPSSFSKPRKALYSAQRVVSLMPTDMKTILDDRRQRAYRAGARSAEAVYQKELARIERERAAAAANSGNSDWNDGGGNGWNNDGTNGTTNGSGWNDDSNTDNGWNDSNTNDDTPSGWNNNNDSPSGWNNDTSNNTDTGSGWNTGDSSDNQPSDDQPSDNGWGDNNSGSSSNNW